jgi:protein arginine N-methyltransferase 3
LAASRQELIDYRKIVEGRYDLTGLVEQINSSEELKPAPRDDDSHYFRSYAENGIQMA